MFTKYLLSIAALPAILLGAASAQAADLPARKSPPPIPAPPPPVFTWTGFHVGFNRGFGGAVSQAQVSIAAPGLGGMATQTFDGCGEHAWIILGYSHSHRAIVASVKRRRALVRGRNGSFRGVLNFA